MSSLRELLSRIKLPSDSETQQVICDELKTALEALAQPGINEDFRNDVMKTVAAMIDLAKTVSRPVYQTDEILVNLSLISTRIAFLLQHIASSRPRTVGFGLVHQNSGKVLPNIWLAESEAKMYVDSMRNMGALPPSVAIIPVEVTSRYVVRPTAAIPPPPAQPPTDPLPRILTPVNPTSPETKPPSTAQPSTEPRTDISNPEKNPPFEVPGPVVPGEPDKNT